MENQAPESEIRIRRGVPVQVTIEVGPGLFVEGAARGMAGQALLYDPDEGCAHALAIIIIKQIDHLLATAFARAREDVERTREKEGEKEGDDDTTLVA